MALLETDLIIVFEKVELGLVELEAMALSESGEVGLTRHQSSQEVRYVVAFEQQRVEVQFVYVLQFVLQHQFVEVRLDLFHSSPVLKHCLFVVQTVF